MCNVIYHSLNKINTSEIDISTDNDNDDNGDSDSDSDDDVFPPNNKNNINENIDSVINTMPDSTSDVLLKIDINKLNSIKKLKYKNIVYQSR